MIHPYTIYVTAVPVYSIDRKYFVSWDLVHDLLGLIGNAKEKP